MSIRGRWRARQERSSAQDSSGLQVLHPKCQIQNHKAVFGGETRAETQNKRLRAKQRVLPGGQPCAPGLAGSPQSLGSRKTRKVSFDCPLMPGRGKKGWVLQDTAGTCC